MFGSIILLGGLVSAFGLGAINPIQEKQDNVQFRLENHKSAYVIDDTNYTITLSGEELSYSYENLQNSLLTTYLSDYSCIVLTYLGNSYDIVRYNVANKLFEFRYIQDDSIYWINGYFSKGDVALANDLVINVNRPLTFDFPSLVSAFELDIQANTPTINDGIFETLTSSVVAFVGSLGSGIVSMTGIFYDSTNNILTTIGLLSVIVVAVSLTYFLFRLIIGLIRMRG